jgi:hypothetical protein
MVYHRLLRILFYQRSVSSIFCTCTNKKIKNNKETDRVLFLSNKEKLYRIPPSIYPGILYNFLRHFPQSTSGTNAKYTTFCWIFHRNTILLIEENGYYIICGRAKKNILRAIMKSCIKLIIIQSLGTKYYAVTPIQILY